MRIEASDEPLYYISVAARLVDCHPQTLRTYERQGLVEPGRSASNVRLYSDEDIERLRQIKRLTQELGVNLAGVEIILSLLDQIEQLHAEVKRLRHELEHGPRRLKPAPQPEVTRVNVTIKEGGRAR